MITPISEQLDRKLYFLLSHLDRDPYSPSYGCFDRLFWGWKLKDFPDATLQRLLYPLTKRLEQKGKVQDHLSSLKAGFLFCSKILHKDGSVDQAFPQEHSHAATAFLLFDLSKTYRLLLPYLSEREQQRTLSILQKMGNYLLRKDEKHGGISNHILGAGAALISLFKITNDEAHEKKAFAYVDRIINQQDQEGWFPEYGGADPGYQTLGLYYLANFYQETHYEKALESLKTGVTFISYFIHPDGTIGGTYGSRNTEVFYPGGLAILHEIPLSKAILDFMRPSIESFSTTNLEGIDLWNLAPLMNNYLQMEEEGPSSTSSALLPFQEVFTQHFENSGFFIQSTPEIYGIIGISKGGVFKVFDKQAKTKIISDDGFIGKKGKQLLTTQHLHHPSYSLKKDQMVITASLTTFNRQIPSPVKFLLLRIFNLSLGRLEFFREGIKKVLVALLVQRNPTSFQLQRIIQLETFSFSDKLLNGEEKITPLETSPHIRAIHMASSKYWQGKIDN